MVYLRYHWTISGLHLLGKVPGIGPQEHYNDPCRQRPGAIYIADHEFWTEFELWGSENVHFFPDQPVTESL